VENLKKSATTLTMREAEEAKRNSDVRLKPVEKVKKEGSIFTTTDD
jgi:hypothetical protein